MILTVQVLIVLTLAATLITIYLDELREAKRTAPRADVEEIWFGAERRKHKRLRVKLEVTYSLPPNARRKRPTTTQTENISMGGVKFHAEEKLEKGVPILISLKLPHAGKPIVVGAEVAWVADTPDILPSGKRSFGTGVMFTDIKPAEKKELSNFIGELLTSQ